MVETITPQRIFIINVNIVGNSSPSFSADIYNATLRNDVIPETAVLFDKEIRMINVPNSTDLHISIISNSTDLPFVLSYKKKRNIHYAELYISRRLKLTDGIFQSFYIGALDKRNLIRLAVARIDISLEEVPVSAPKFNNVHYFKQMDELRPHVTVLRVAAKTSKGAVVYRIEPEDVPFDVTPFSGDIFSRYSIPNGKYSFDIIATDSLAQEARANVRIMVGPRIDPKRQFKELKTKNSHHRRSRRDFGDEIVITLKENHSIGLLEEKINLRPDEKVVFAPTTTDYLKIHGNGLIELIKPLNYEFEITHQAAVQISGLFKGQPLFDYYPNPLGSLFHSLPYYVVMLILNITE
ncbi:unnamed protein product [Cercopithifilaria johnstoni]|uniref:Cadherin domain-containing protein n=1 Tax=Cercopithifilaria johnstoni TaxID=2874296 RepID=A0A8J2MHR2_9BILA|nr:unnamed protein product [Cercopithifilaria johnstoni]